MAQRVAVIGVAGQRLGMDGELSAFGVAVRRRHRDLDAELVGTMGLALADALHFRRVQGIDLRSAAMLLLIAHAPGPRQNIGEHHFLEPAIALDLAGDVTDDAAQIGPKRL